MDKKVFHQATIGGMLFMARMGGLGPQLICEAGSAPIGHVTQIAWMEPDGSRVWDADRPTGWYVVKYRSERKIYLRGFSRSDVESLSAEFGILIRSAETELREESSDAVLQSRAWPSLVRWVKLHPRLAKSAAAGDDYYLPGWYEATQSG